MNLCLELCKCENDIFRLALAACFAKAWESRKSFANQIWAFSLEFISRLIIREKLLVNSIAVEGGCHIIRTYIVSIFVQISEIHAGVQR